MSNKERKILTFEEIESLNGVTASYVDGKDSICEELDYLEIAYNRQNEDVFELIRRFESDLYSCDNDLYQVTDLEKVNTFKAKILGFNYGMLIVNGGADIEDVETDFGVSYVQSDFKEEMLKVKIEITDEFIENNLSDIEAGYHDALEKIGLK